MTSSTAPLTTWQVFALSLALGAPEHEINAGTRDGSLREKDIEVPRPKPQESIYGHSVLPWRVNLDEHAFVAGHYIGSE